MQELEEFQEEKKLHCEGNSVMEGKIDLNLNSFKLALYHHYLA